MSNNLPASYPMAMAIRLAQINLLKNGVTKSREVATTSDNAILLSELLGYSSITVLHNIDLLTMLEAIRPQAISQNKKDKYDDLDRETEYDLLFCEEGKNPVYYFTHRIIEPVKKTWQDDLFSMSADILQDWEHDGIWRFCYHALYLDETSEFLIHGSNLYPEKQMLLNFWYSPKQLDGECVFRYLMAAPIVKDCLMYLSETNINGFRRFDIKFDGMKQALLEEEMPLAEEIVRKTSKFLRDRGNFTFPIWEIGTCQLEGQNFWIYTGSEERIKV